MSRSLDSSSQANGPPWETGKAPRAYSLWVLAAACMGTLMVSLDRTMMAVALPTIGAEVGFRTATQLMSVYLLASGGSLLIGGRLSDLFGQRDTLLAGACIFALASLACALSQMPQLLIVLRYAQGVGAAFLALGPSSLSLRGLADSSQRAKPLSVSTSVSWITQSLGPFIGGSVLAQAVDWHRLFLVDALLGGILIILTLVCLPQDRRSCVGKRRTLSRAFFAVALLLPICYVITSWDGSVTTLHYAPSVFVAVDALTLIWFLRSELYESTPVVSLAALRVLRQGIFGASCIAGALLGATLYVAYLVYPSYLQLALGYNPLQVALILFPLTLIPAGIALAGIPAKLMKRVGLGGASLIGLIFIGTGLALLTGAPVDRHTAAYHLAPSMLAYSLGLGIAPVPLFLLATSSVTGANAGIASGAYITSCSIGSGLGVALLGSISSAYGSELLVTATSSRVAANGACQLSAGAGALLAFVGAVFVTCISNPARRKMW